MTDRKDDHYLRGDAISTRGLQSGCNDIEKDPGCWTLELSMVVTPPF